MTAAAAAAAAAAETAVFGRTGSRADSGLGRQ